MQRSLVAPKPSQGLTPACLLGALEGARVEALGSHGEGFPVSAAALTFPHRVSEWYGRQPTACYSVPASLRVTREREGGEGLQPSSRGRSPGNPPGPSSPPASLGPSPSRLALSFPGKHLPFEGVWLQK